jgi:hypothetical protein
MLGRLSDNIFLQRKTSSTDPSGCFISSGRRSFLLFSALAGIVIWLLTFIVLVSFTEISIIFNKLISVLAVLTFWLIRWYRNVNQYILDSKHENRILNRLRVIFKYSITEIFHFIILFSFLMILMVFIEKYF